MMFESSETLFILSTLIYALIALSFWFAQPKGMDLLLIIFLLCIGNISYEISQIFYNGQLKLITTENNYANLNHYTQATEEA